MLLVFRRGLGSTLLTASTKIIESTTFELPTSALLEASRFCTKPLIGCWVLFCIYRLYYTLPLQPVILNCVQPQKGFHVSLGLGRMMRIAAPQVGQTGFNEFCLTRSLYSLCFFVAWLPVQQPHFVSVRSDSISHLAFQRPCLRVTRRSSARRGPVSSVSSCGPSTDLEHVGHSTTIAFLPL